MPIFFSGMKKLFFLLAGITLPCSAFELPRGFFTADTIEEARVEAAAKPKMVSFLISRPSLEAT